MRGHRPVVYAQLPEQKRIDVSDLCEPLAQGAADVADARDAYQRGPSRRGRRLQARNESSRVTGIHARVVGAADQQYRRVRGAVGDVLVRRVRVKRLELRRVLY